MAHVFGRQNRLITEEKESKAKSDTRKIMLGIFKAPDPLLVSEPDITAALQHLRNLPFRQALPRSWDRKRLLDKIRKDLGPNPAWNAVAEVAPGVFAIVKPYWCDVSGQPPADMMGRKQVWLLIRAFGTDTQQVTEF